MLRKHLRRKLRTFEETQISNIIRRAKGKRTLLLKFHQFYSAKKPEGIPINLENNSATGNNRRPIFLNRKPFKNKTGTSKVGAISKAQKTAKFLNL